MTVDTIRSSHMICERFDVAMHRTILSIYHCCFVVALACYSYIYIHSQDTYNETLLTLLYPSPFTGTINAGIVFLALERRSLASHGG